MKPNRLQLANLYISPRNKEVDSTRKIYLNGGLLSKTNRSKNQKEVKELLKQLSLKKKLSSLKNCKSQDPLIFSDRMSKQKQLGRRDSSLKQGANNKQRSVILKSGTKYSNSTARLNKSSRMSKLQKSQKSTMLSQLQSATLRFNLLKEKKKSHEAGKNCRVVVIQGTNQEQHFVQIDKIGDIMTYLKKQYPRYLYYKSIPSQITIDYLLMEESLTGKFLNGQSLYLKPCGRFNSVDQPQEVCLQSFQIIKLIGSGGFSKVFLSRFKEDGKFYAMKVIDKEVIVKNKKKRIIMNERNIMKSANHPFVIDMKFAFQSQKYLVFVVEYCSGGELFGLIKKHRKISEEMARFYIIQIFLGLSYLHSQNVVYRDVKPQNILLSQDGHVKIADLGLAKPDMFQGELAYSFCGSPQYMSPQMITQVGHTFPVDHYCMGALLYQLLTGLPPFYSRDPNQIYEAVLSEDLTFPQQVQITQQCKSLLRGLLCKQTKKRLGSIHGIKQILAHPWFGKNNYPFFLQKRVQPPVSFNSISKLNLDNYTNEQKNKKQVQQVKKQQKIQRKRFKKVMKGFYFDFRQQRQTVKKNFKSQQSQNKQNFIDKLDFRRRRLSKENSQTSNRKRQHSHTKTQQNSEIQKASIPMKRINKEKSSKLFNPKNFINSQRT